MANTHEGGGLSFLLYSKATGPWTGDWQLFMTETLGGRVGSPTSWKRKPLINKMCALKEEDSPGIRGPEVQSHFHYWLFQWLRASSSTDKVTLGPTGHEVWDQPVHRHWRGKKNHNLFIDLSVKWLRWEGLGTAPDPDSFEPQTLCYTALKKHLHEERLTYTYMYGS